MSPWTPERIARLTRLRAEGLSYERIAVELGLTKDQCIGKGKRLHLPTPAKPQSKPFKLAPSGPGKPKLIPTGKRPHVPLTAYTAPRGQGCKWPHDDYSQRIKDGREPFCGEPTHNGSSWCQVHGRKVFAVSRP